MIHELNLVQEKFDSMISNVSRITWELAQLNLQYRGSMSYHFEMIRNLALDFEKHKNHMSIEEFITAKVGADWENFTTPNGKKMISIYEYCGYKEVDPRTVNFGAVTNFCKNKTEKYLLPKKMESVEANYGFWRFPIDVLDEAFARLPHATTPVN